MAANKRVVRQTHKHGSFLTDALGHVALTTGRLRRGGRLARVFFPEQYPAVVSFLQFIAFGPRSDTSFCNGFQVLRTAPPLTQTSRGVSRLREDLTKLSRSPDGCAPQIPVSVRVAYSPSTAFQVLSGLKRII